VSYKLKIIKQGDGIEVVGNREGLKHLGEICLALSDLSDSEAVTAANHYHFADFMNNAEEGSIEMVVLLNQNL
jgi:hypothetical protein